MPMAFLLIPNNCRKKVDRFIIYDIIYIKHKLSKNVDISLLKKLGFTDKCAQVYLALLRLGPSSVRALAEESGLNRGTTYDA